MALSNYRVSGLPLLLACALLYAPPAHAGGEMGDPDHHDDDGTPFFGFVKDADGKPVVDAKVTAQVKNGTRFVARTSNVGMYNFGALNKQINPNDVTISCEKDGYKQLRVIKRPPSTNPSNKAVETECRLQRG